MIKTTDSHHDRFSPISFSYVDLENVMIESATDSEFRETPSPAITDKVIDLFQKLTKQRIEESLRQKNYRGAVNSCRHYIQVKNNDISSTGLAMIQSTCQSLFDTGSSAEAREILSFLPDTVPIEHTVCSIASVELKNKPSKYSKRASRFLALTGKTKDKEIVGSPNLTRNIQIARQIEAYVKTRFPMPANYALKSLHIQNLVAANKIKKANALIKANFKIQSKARGDIEEIYTCIKLGIGSCQEMSLAGYLFALEHLPHDIEFATIEHGDHNFLVIGRDRNSNPNDHKTWGEHAVVCDPWSGAYYPASLLETNLKDYAGQEFDQSGLLQCKIKAFNPHTQYVKIINPNPPVQPTAEFTQVDETDEPTAKRLKTEENSTEVP